MSNHFTGNPSRFFQYGAKLSKSLNGYYPILSTVIVITLIAAFLRLYGLEDKAFWGDEVNSLIEAQEPIKNPHSFLYFILMHFWSGVSESVIWNRIPAAIFGFLTVVPVYYTVLEISDRKTAFMTALLLSVNAFHIGYSQEIRFYSIYALTSSLCFLFLFRFLRTKKKSQLCGWFLFAVLTMGSHMLGALVVLLSVLLWFLEDTSISRRIRLCVSGSFLLLSMCILAVIYFAPYDFFDFIYRLQGSVGKSSSVLRGFVPTNLAKIPLSFYFFLMGETAYPGNILWACISALTFSLLILRGFYVEYRQNSLLRIVLLTIVPVVFLFLILDMIVPKNFPGADTKYVIFVLPFLLFLVARGCFFKNQLITGISICLVIILSTGNLMAYYSNAYNYNTYKLIDDKGLKAFVSKCRSPNTVYFTETPMEQLQFFPWEKGAENLWSLLSGWQKGTSILDDNEFRGKKLLLHVKRIYRKDLWLWNNFIEDLQDHLILEDCFHSHGEQCLLFRYSPSGHCQIGEDGEVLFPTQLYSLPYDDLHVTRLKLGKGRHFELDSAAAEKVINLMPVKSAKAIEVQGHLIGCSVGKGEKVGSLIITDTRGKQRKFVFIDGENIADWKISLWNEEHSHVQFRKRIKLAGRSAYPDTYKDFSVKTHKAVFDLGELEVLKSLELRFNLREGKMVVWGMRLLY